MRDTTQTLFKKITLFAFSLGVATAAYAGKPKHADLVFKSGHESMQQFLMPEQVPYPEGNKPNADRINLGKKLFFDPRLSKDGNMACATCHSPMFGWSDGLPTAKGFQSKILGRATPTVFNTAFQKIQMWDGRKKSLEDQALGPMVSSDEMNIGVDGALKFIKSNPEYSGLFDAAYPGEGVTDETLAKAIASFERTVLSNNTPFDQWAKGDKGAMSKAAVRGFDLFMDPNKGACGTCHSGSNFTDDGFHNIGLATFGDENADLGRYVIKPIRILKGAFKTPTIREIGQTAPYFHDGSASTLAEVVDHYAKGGVVKTNLSPNMKALTLSEQEKADIVAFMEALTSEVKPFELPVLPK